MLKILSSKIEIASKSRTFCYKNLPYLETFVARIWNLIFFLRLNIHQNWRCIKEQNFNHNNLPYAIELKLMRETESQN